MSKALAIKATGRIDRSGNNVKGNASALDKGFNGDWYKSQKGYFDQSRKARWSGMDQPFPDWK
ncbi:hypothetical protein DPMN_033600 [Dreissena polymorpha]|uniref:Uncharacterized protein n=1 Tax=Dreissena polymorpha TaxID=45954 RepID=A0A9D4M6W9_DREPO|nr:hypothetical protein DPMN_033600 [Dreissena polymorpha]